MLSSISPVGEASRHQRWWVTVAAYVVASVAGGALVGAAAGGVGQVVGVGGSPAVALLVLAVAALLGVAADRRLLGVGLPTWHRQVDERWLAGLRGWVYGAGFGFQLGLGVVTIVTASVTYVALVGAALTGSWVTGGVVGAVFGAVRALPLLLAGRIRTPTGLRALLARVAAAERPFDRATLAAQTGLGVLAFGLAVVTFRGGGA